MAWWLQALCGLGAFIALLLLIVGWIAVNLWLDGE